jgi:type II secretory pathway pseudopilin PulG
MTPRFHSPSRRTAAFTLPELAIVLGVIFVLALLILPPLARSQLKAGRTKCVNQLKNVGLGLRIFSADNKGAWPWQVSTNQGGSREFLQDPSLVWPHFLALSNELSSPRSMRCPVDLESIDTLTWIDSRTNSAFSYFLGLDASEENPNSILGGDSNLELNGQRLRSTLVTLRTNATLQFDNSRHKDPPSGAGNILLGDGSVHQVASARLREALFLPGDPTNSVHRWLIP